MTARRFCVRHPLALTLCLWSSVAVAQGVNQQNQQGGPFDTYRPLTPAADFITAQSKLAVAMGQYQESLATARNGHAEAYSKELENKIAEIDTWIERKNKNREYRQALNPNYTKRQARQSLATRRRIEEQYDDLTRGDVTQYLNWMLEQLATSQYARFRGGEDSDSTREPDRPLTPEDLKHLVLTDGGRLHGERLTFRASDGRVLDTDWPLALRGPEFKADREHFERVRDEVLQELAQGGELHYDDAQRLQQAHDNLEAAYFAHYGYARTEVGREERLADYSTYLAGKRYLDALALSVQRVLTTNDQRIFDGSYAFHGKTVRELVWHMCERGCQFAPPEAGDEGTYVKLFYDMRHLYLQHLAAHDPAEQATLGP